MKPGLSRLVPVGLVAGVLVVVGLAISGLLDPLGEKRAPDLGSTPGGTDSTARTLRIQEHLARGFELSRLFEPRRALVEFEKCLAIDPGHREARLQKARLLLVRGIRPAGREALLRESLAILARLGIIQTK